jgi:putative nucleotidyltransferase-like protein
VNRALAGTVVGCLSFYGEACEANMLRKFPLHDWYRAFNWLDRAGLTLYFLQRLKSRGAAELLPPPVLARFEQNLADNRRRVDYLAAEFGSLNERFGRAGLNYAAIKGFSLVPTYCPSAVLRAPSDLDYLVDKPSLPLAQRILEEAGYRLHRFSDIEFKFGRPSPRIPTVSDDPYSPETEPLVELHLAFCKGSENRVLMNEPEFRLDQTISHTWQGLRFPVLREEDAFVFQILHVFQHTLECWVKLCWLFEIGYFLRTRLSDAQFWDRVDVRMREVPCLAEFAAVVMGLAEKAFAAPMPPIAAKWTQCLRLPARLWLENYGRRWAFEEHPYDSLSLFSAAKLALFLHREFIPDPNVRKKITQQRLFPCKRPEQIAVPTDKTAASSLTQRRLQWQFVLHRLIFHLGSGSQYLWEIPRWRELNRLSGSHKSHHPDTTPRGDLSNPKITPN